MAPEQACGDAIDHRADIYAVGCLVYEMITGSVPHHAASIAGLLAKHVHAAPQPPSERAPAANIPPEVDAVILKALAKAPSQRFQTMKEMALALAACGGLSGESAWGGEPSQAALPTFSPARSATGRRPTPLETSRTTPDAPRSAKRAVPRDLVRFARVAALAVVAMAAVASEIHLGSARSDAARRAASTAVAPGSAAPSVAGRAAPPVRAEVGPVVEPVALAKRAAIAPATPPPEVRRRGDERASTRGPEARSTRAPGRKALPDKRPSRGVAVEPRRRPPRDPPRDLMVAPL